MDGVLEALSTLGVGALIGFAVKSWLDKKAKDEERNYQIKKDIYIRVSQLMQDWLGGGDEKEIVSRGQKILGEAYIVAPDKVILGIKKVWEDRDKKGDIKGDNMKELVYTLRKDLVSGTRLKDEDHFFIHF